MTDLVLFTAQFPYGIESEPFLETEVPILADHFDRIIIIPSLARDTMRPIPSSAEVVPMGWTAEPSVAARLAALGSPQARRVIRWSAGAPSDLAAHIKAPRMYVDILGRSVLKYRELSALIQIRGLHDAVFYDYWFENATLALALLRTAGVIRAAIARAHGFDVYDERWDGRPVPFRQAKAHGLDAVYPTSHTAERYLRERVPALRSKMEVRYLGVSDPGAPNPAPDPGAPPLILTCAMFEPVKRLHLVPEALSRLLEVPFRWVHIGDGPGRDAVETEAQRLLPAGSFKFLGQMPNSQVHEFYRTHSVRCLLSVSSSEGLPVSMMEALSYGVPVVACDVGGVRELVTDRTGVLLSQTATPREIAVALRTALTEGRFDPAEIRDEWRSRYDASGNYNRFAEMLLELHRDSAGR